MLKLLPCGRRYIESVIFKHRHIFSEKEEEIVDTLNFFFFLQNFHTGETIVEEWASSSS